MRRSIESHPVVAYLQEQEQAMVQLLRRCVEAESPSTEPEAQAAVQAVLREALEDAGLCVWHQPGRGRSGGHLYARPDPRPRGRPIQLLLGHCDTVWPRGTLQTMPFRLRGNKIRGPGVFDMKAGLVQMIFALQALHALHVQPEVVPVVFINSDEEIGSWESRQTVAGLARGACRAFVLEPGLGLEGALKTRRKGTGVFTIEVHGRSAHAGLDPESGASAIVELSHLIQKLHALNDPATGVTVNVGRIDGGVRANVVASGSTAVVDVRVPSREAAHRLEAAIRGLEPTTPGTRLIVTGGIGRPPLEKTSRNAALWQAAQEQAAVLGIELAEGLAGGGSDGSFASQHTATLDGLGAVGDGAHADHEYCYRDKLVERSALLALLLLLPADPSSLTRPDTSFPEVAATAGLTLSTEP